MTDRDGLAEAPIDCCDPVWGEAGKTHDWKNYVNQGLRAAWPSFTPSQRALIAINAQERADQEEWD